MATFPLHLSIRVLTKGRNAKIFPWNTHLKEKDFDRDLDEKNEACFFMDKKVATSMNSNTVCAFPQCENSKVLCSSRSILEQAVSFLIPERLEEKKNWSWKKFNYCPLSSENLTDLWFQLSRKIEKSQTRWHLSHVIQKSKTTLQTWTLRVMCSFRKKNTTAELNFSFLTENINDR